MKEGGWGSYKCVYIPVYISLLLTFAHYIFLSYMEISDKLLLKTVYQGNETWQMSTNVQETVMKYAVGEEKIMKSYIDPCQNSSTAACEKRKRLRLLKSLMFPDMEHDIIKIYLHDIGLGLETINKWTRSINMGVSKSLTKNKCEFSNCDIIIDPSRIAEADFVLFIEEIPTELPQRRYPWQSYIHKLKERPIDRQVQGIRLVDQHINISFTYRFDSDIYFDNHHYYAPSTNPNTEPYRMKYPLSSRPKSVVWMVSHCGAKSRRDEYTAELAKYIDVDIYGKCGPLNCTKSRQSTADCFDEFEKTYKFYLSFENSICKDYITEKAYRPLGHEMIPIVLGGGNYTKTTPPHSVINVMDYETPRHLAEYLRKLMVDEAKFAEYFSWKGKYEPIHPRMVCDLCKGVNDPVLATKEAGGYADWWLSGCDNKYFERQWNNW